LDEVLVKVKYHIINKLKYALRHNRTWHTKVIPDKKKEQKKNGEFKYTYD
tara:strand:- start:6074 stop:6223 length:150 start_codon:yes stop_codon:yes gene_type:complete